MIKNISILLMSLSLISCNSDSVIKKKPNVLFIAIDDLRPELGCYGSDLAQSPNLDALAAKGLLFNRAYCQQAICGVSRPSLLTGCYPEHINITHNYTIIREANPDIITLPQYFKNNGYETVYTGKVFHHGDNDDAISWSRTPAVERLGYKQTKLIGGYALKENQDDFQKNRQDMIAKYGEQAKYGFGNGPAFECADVPDNTYSDGYNTDLAIATLEEMLEQNPDKPFFLGLGMNKPHLNWCAPKKYWDLYNTEEMPLAEIETSPLGASAMGLHASFELRTRYNIPNKGDLDEQLQKELKHAYLACVSYIDAQIGRMVDALEKNGVMDNTIIVVWSDHGWHLGDMGIWGKATNYEVATRVPFIVWTPDMNDEARGVRTNALVELIDIYPSLCEYAGLPIPEDLDGESFLPLLSDPNQSWKEIAFSQFPDPALREWGAIPLRKGMRETFFGPLIEEVEEVIRIQQKDKWDRALFEEYLMGYSMRTDRYRLIVWKDRRKPKNEPIYIELYDHDLDPLESENIAQENSKILKSLLALFEKESVKRNVQVPLLP